MYMYIIKSEMFAFLIGQTNGSEIFIFHISEDDILL